MVRKNRFYCTSCGLTIPSHNKGDSIMFMQTILRSTVVAVSMACALGAQAGTYPERVVTVVVPYSPGGSSDQTARVVARGLTKVLGQTVIVENKPGAGGNIGAAFVRQSSPDGYTLLFAVSSHATNMTLYKNPNYDLVKDFAPVSLISYIPNVLVVPTDFPAKNLGEFIAAAKKPGAKIFYGSAGNGSSSHLAAALFNEKAGLGMEHIPYKGGSPANQDLLTGRLQAVFAPMVEVLPFIETGKMKALGVTTEKRSSRLPDVAAIGEVLPGYKAVLWNSLMVPKGTDPAVVARLASAVKTVLQDPETRKLFETQGTQLVGSSSEEFARLLPQEVKAWGELVKISNASID
jgi:tripartite-type tricarboxylate transporter receptor subunit TctC